MYKQLIIARRDLNMSPGKLAAQVSHASMAFLTTMIRENTPRIIHVHEHGHMFYETNNICIPKELYEGWINGSFTKVVCGARNLGKLHKAVDKAISLGMREGEDFFIIRDACRTELEPEEVLPDGSGVTITCIGFKPMPEEIIDQIGKEYHLY